MKADQTHLYTPLTTHICIYTHTRTHTHTHARMHTHTHTHTLYIRALLLSALLAIPACPQSRTEKLQLSESCNQTDHLITERERERERGRERERKRGR